MSPRFDIQVVLNLFPSVVVAAEALNVPRRYVYRWTEVGLDEAEADTIAIGLGLHPIDLWPDEWASLMQEDEHPTVPQQGSLW